MRATFLTSVGCLCLLAGAVGIVIPVLPTTPFALLAAGCFASANPRLYEWLYHSRLFGEYIQNHKEKTGVSRRVKSKSLLFLWGMLFLSILTVARWEITLLLVCIGLLVSAHILLLKTR